MPKNPNINVATIRPLLFVALQKVDPAWELAADGALTYKGVLFYMTGDRGGVTIKLNQRNGYNARWVGEISEFFRVARKMEAP